VDRRAGAPPPTGDWSRPAASRPDLGASPSRCHSPLPGDTLTAAGSSRRPMPVQADLQPLCRRSGPQVRRLDGELESALADPPLWTVDAGGDGGRAV